MKALPACAKRADPARVVRLLCKGVCSCVRWAEMEEPYPGTEVLRQAQVGAYTAKCLKCGRMARDPYNWFR